MRAENNTWDLAGMLAEGETDEQWFVGVQVSEPRIGDDADELDLLVPVRFPVSQPCTWHPRPSAN